LSCAFSPDVMNHEIPIAKLPSDADAPAIGVRKPIKSAVPTRISSNPIAQLSGRVGDPISVLIL